MSHLSKKKSSDEQINWHYDSWSIDQRKYDSEKKKHTCESFEIYSIDNEFEFDKMSDLFENFYKLDSQFNITRLSMNSVRILNVNSVNENTLDKNSMKKKVDKFIDLTLVLWKIKK